MLSDQYRGTQQSSGFSRLALLLALGYTLLLVYGTLFPLSGWQTPAIGPWELMLQRGFSNTSRADIITNLLVYLPLGVLLMRALSARRCSVCMLLGVTLGSAMLSLSLELIQAHLPGRVPSVADLLLNTIGGCIGALLALILQREMLPGASLYRIRKNYFLPGPRTSFGIMILGLWALSQLSPLVPSVDLGNLRLGVKPLWHTLQQPASLDWLRLAEYTLAIVALGLLSDTLLRLRYHSLQLFSGFVAVVLLLKIPVLNRQLSLEALLGLGLGIMLLVLVRRSQSHLKLLAAVFAIVGSAIAAGLYAPADSADLYARPFNWIPFQSHLQNDLVGLIDILAGIWPFLALSYFGILASNARSMLAPLLASVPLFLTMFALEWYQQYLPGRSADITDALIAMMAWLLPWLYRPLRHQQAAADPLASGNNTPTGKTPSRYGMALVSLFALLVAVGLVWKSVSVAPLERPLDESKLYLLPSPSELPPVQLTEFRYRHPRLPAPDSMDIVRLQNDNPAYLSRQKKHARNGKGDLFSIIVTEYIEPGSQDLAMLYERLMSLENSWRGHQQAKPVAVAYDWLYDYWSDEQRRGLQGKLLENANYLIHRIREEQRLSPYNVYLYNSPLQALMATVIALYGDDPGGDLPMRYLADYWKNRVLPVWRQIMGNSGGWHEGGEYVGIGIGQAIYQMPAMWRKATGEDLFRSEAGIRGFLDFLVYRTRPDGTHFRWGDGGFFDQKVPDRIPLAIEYRHAAAYSLGGCPRRQEPTSWPWGPLPDSSLCDHDAMSRLPTARHFDGIGMIVARSDWSPDATYVTFKAGDNYWSHNHLDQGSFTIYKGAALAIDSGAYGGGGGYGSDHHFNYSYQTIAHNTITVRDPDDTVPMLPRKNEAPRRIANDGGQRRIGSGWGVEAAPLDLEEWLGKREIYHTGKLEGYLEQDGLVVGVSDITPAYTNLHSGQGTFSHRTRRVERLWRTFGYDAVDDVIVILDQVRSTQPQFQKRWLLHSTEQPVQTDNGFAVSSPAGNRNGQSGGRLEGYILLPRAPQVKITGGKQAAFLVDGTDYAPAERHLQKRKNTEAGAWRIELSPSTDSEDALFLVVMLPSSAASRPTHQVRLLEEEGRFGCEVAGPKRTTRWWFTANRNGLDIEVIAPDGERDRHMLWPG